MFDVQARKDSIECNTTVSAAHSSITGIPPQRSGTPNAVLQPVDIELPPTLTTKTKTLVISNEEKIGNDEDADGQLGPFLRRGRCE